MRKAFLVFASLAVCIFIYSPSVNGPYLWDDEVIIVQNAFIRSLSHLKDIFTTNLFAGASGMSNFYRPFTVLTYLVGYKIWGLNPLFTRLSNLAVHLSVSFLLFLIASRLFKHFWLSFFCSVFFLVHPLATEVVSYPSGCESYMMLFFLLSFLMCMLYLENHKIGYLFCSYAFFVASMLYKEMAIMLPFLIWFYIWFRYNFKYHKCLNGFFFLLGIYTLLRLTVLNFYHTSLWQFAQPQVFDEHLFRRLLTFAKVNFTYLRLFFAPFNLHQDRDIPFTHSFLDPLALRAIAIQVSLLAFLIHRAKKEKGIFFGIGWYVIMLIPVSNIIPLNTAIAERHMYSAMPGLFIIAALLLKNASKKAIYILVIYFIFFCFLNFQRNREWSDPPLLYKSTIENSKYSFRANNNLGVVYFRRGEYAQAEHYFNEAVRILPSYSEALNNLGVISEIKGDQENAIIYYKKSIENQSDYSLAYINLARIYLRRKQASKAREVLEDLLAIYPYNSEARQLLASITE